MWKSFPSKLPEGHKASTNVKLVFESFQKSQIAICFPYVPILFLFNDSILLSRFPAVFHLPFHSVPFFLVFFHLYIYPLVIKHGYISMISVHLVQGFIGLPCFMTNVPWISQCIPWTITVILSPSFFMKSKLRLPHGNPRFSIMFPSFSHGSSHLSTIFLGKNSTCQAVEARQPDGQWRAKLTRSQAYGD